MACSRSGCSAAWSRAARPTRRSWSPGCGARLPFLCNCPQPRECLVWRPAVSCRYGRWRQGQGIGALQAQPDGHVRRGSHLTSSAPWSIGLW